MLLKPAPAAVSWVQLAAYLSVFVGSLMLVPGAASADAQWYDDLATAAKAMCAIYCIDVAFAWSTGTCAMAGGWTLAELTLHHLPYVLAVLLVLHAPGAHLARWSTALLLSVLTSGNEASFCAVALGAPHWFERARHVYAFSLISLLLAAETLSYARAVLVALDGVWTEWYAASIRGVGAALVELVATQLMLGAIYFHVGLVKAYLRIFCRRSSKGG